MFEPALSVPDVEKAVTYAFMKGYRARTRSAPPSTADQPIDDFSRTFVKDYHDITKRYANPFDYPQYSGEPVPRAPVIMHGVSYGVYVDGSLARIITPNSQDHHKWIGNGTNSSGEADAGGGWQVIVCDFYVAKEAEVELRVSLNRPDWVGGWLFGGARLDNYDGVF
jgi:hypothetical protein